MYSASALARRHSFCRESPNTLERRVQMSSLPNGLCTMSVDEACLFRAQERIGQRKAAAQLCVLRDGEVVLRSYP